MCALTSVRCLCCGLSLNVLHVLYTCVLLLAGVLTQVVGSLTYFQRALVVSAAAAVHGPTFRTSFFAALNTWSAAAILVMQVGTEGGQLSGNVGRQSCGGR